MCCPPPPPSYAFCVEIGTHHESAQHEAAGDLGHDRGGRWNAYVRAKEAERSQDHHEEADQGDRPWLSLCWSLVSLLRVLNVEVSSFNSAAKANTRPPTSIVFCTYV